MGRPVSMQIDSRFGRLVVLRRAPDRALGQTRWECQCDCGNYTTVYAGSLRRGDTVSCGCYHREASSRRNSTHRMTGSPTHVSWNRMLQRCRNPKSPDYPQYGGRGIGVCDRWSSFEAFLADMGQRPSLSYSLDRIDNDGGYEPGNCKWATRAEQQNNRRTTKRITYNGETLALGDWARRTNIPAKTLHMRHERLGWTPGQTLGFESRLRKSRRPSAKKVDTIAGVAD